MPLVNCKLKIFSVNPKCYFMIHQKIKIGILSTHHEIYLTSSKHSSIQNIQFLVKKSFGQSSFFIRSTHFLVNQVSTKMLIWLTTKKYFWSNGPNAKIWRHAIWPITNCPILHKWDVNLQCDQMAWMFIQIFCHLQCQRK